jgi:phosphatidylglycerophosphate synthase
MALYVHIVGESSVRLWGLTSRQRLVRVLKSAGVTDVVEDIASVPENSSVLLLRADYLYDDRLIHYLVEIPDILLRFTDQHTDAIIAAHVSSARARQARDVLAGAGEAESLREVRTETLETLSISFQERLRKFEPPFILSITPKDRRILERRLFDWSYKGVTDLVTKWAWPHPARWAVGQCARFGLRPNHVTIVGLFLVVLAGILFAYGQYGWGLLAGWLMTFLDTVDGKLARVTVTSSRFGHYFDHIIDIVHPPIWYILWGIGLEVYNPGAFGLSLGALFWLIMAGYVAGRLVEATFTGGLGRFGIFCWRPVDSYFRLITARRNPCMILLTGCTLFGRPDLGLVAVASWTVLTSIFLFIRLAMAFYVRIRKGPLRSWLKDADQQFYTGSLALRLFTRRIAG